MDASTNRTLWMRRLVQEAGGPARWIAKFGEANPKWSTDQVSQWTSEDRPKSIGRVLARNLEKAQQLPHGILDTPPNPEQPLQSQPARLSGEMVRMAYRDARELAMQGGAEADDFDPFKNADDAGIYAVALNRILRKPAGQDSSTVEIGDGSSGRTGATRGGQDAKEAGGEGRTSPRKSRKRAA